MSRISHTPEVSFELDTFTLILLSEGERAGALEEAEVERLLGEHVEYTLGLVAEGHLLAAGALDDQAREGRLTGLGFSTKTPDDLRPLVEGDPAVTAGLEKFTLVTYRCPKGSIAFPGVAVGQ